MSTALSYAPQQNTANVDQYNTDDAYRYGQPGTDMVYTEEKTVPKQRTTKKATSDLVADKKIEIIKQKWSGVVVEFNNEELTAKLEDLTNPDNPGEFIVLSLEEIEGRDRELIQAGAMFLWHIGYRLGYKYPRERFSKISFRRLPKWTKSEIISAENIAKEYADFFLSDTTHST